MKYLFLSASAAFILLTFSINRNDICTAKVQNEVYLMNEEPDTVKADQLNVVFKNVHDEKIKRCFITVLEAYEILHPYEITLVQKRIKSSTMQAQPVFGIKGFFGGVKRYKINLAEYVCDSDEEVVAELPEEVLTGWFAHELGHLADYEQYSNMGMVRYGIRYLTSKKFKKKAEHDADQYAIDHGFHEEIIAAKKYILEHEFLTDAYKAKIKAFYMSIEDVEVCVDEEKVPLVPDLN